ncbi:XRE family transcriptional regulator [Ornithinimicrobium ciconiae]|uniref:XRE family transcriptional regulator n=1 Tax=Ornithinimicrobium ciconiae TaxID=2594265 RepID=A0A516G6M4_9MICO|nr:XRE family transcriptional regulator [Ornithinimicrobium ciconiae]QDO87155.1 XRE family transcriptional regulator [Ornithinimicrobium ciconiae]
MLSDTAEDLASFATTLREAIDQRGLGLGRIVARLEEAGTPVSAATLSYWQSGRSRPGRRSSLDCVSTLEQILELAPGHLVGQLGRPAVRGRNPQPPTWSELWNEVPAVVSAFEQITSSVDDHLTRVSYHDRVQVGPDHTERSTWTRQIMRSERDGVDRFVAMYGNDDPRSPLPQARALQRCEILRTTSEAGSGVVVVEMMLPRPLRRGEFVTVEYEFVQSAPYPPAHRYERRRRGANRQYVLEVLFDGQELPARCERYSQVVDGEEESEELYLDPDHGLLLVELDGRPGVVGARWDWPEGAA